MGDEHSQTRSATNSRGSARSTSPHQAAYATERARLLFACYRRADAADPDGYLAAITAVLLQYDSDLIREVTDPRFGISTTEKHASFMPTSGELKRYCEAEAERKSRLKRLGDLPKPNPLRLAAPNPRDAAPGAYANVFVPDGHPRYSSLVKWSETADPRLFRFGRSSDARVGIWISHAIWDSGAGRSIGAAAAVVAKEINPSEAAE